MSDSLRLINKTKLFLGYDNVLTGSGKERPFAKNGSDVITIRSSCSPDLIGASISIDKLQEGPNFTINLGICILKDGDVLTFQYGKTRSFYVENSAPKNSFTVVSGGNNKTWTVITPGSFVFVENVSHICDNKGKIVLYQALKETVITTKSLDVTVSPTFEEGIDKIELF